MANGSDEFLIDNVLRDVLREQDTMMNVGVASHRKSTGHKKVWKGSNFIQCDECGYHAHVVSNPVRLVEHNADYSVMKITLP